jgi:hypothetical protein
VLAAGEKIGTASVWTAPHERATIEELVAQGHVLFLFYLFDWSAT